VNVDGDVGDVLKREVVVACDTDVPRLRVDQLQT